MSLIGYIEEIFIDHSHVIDKHSSMTEEELSEEYKKIDIKYQYIKDNLLSITDDELSEEIKKIDIKIPCIYWILKNDVTIRLYILLIKRRYYKTVQYLNTITIMWPFMRHRYKTDYHWYKAVKLQNKCITPYNLTDVTCPNFILKFIKILRKKYTLNQIINWDYSGRHTQIMTEAFELISLMKSPRFQFIQACILLE
jgi:hypothetical protein